MNDGLVPVPVVRPKTKPKYLPQTEPVPITKATATPRRQFMDGSGCGGGSVPSGSPASERGSVGNGVPASTTTGQAQAQQPQFYNIATPHVREREGRVVEPAAAIAPLARTSAKVVTSSSSSESQQQQQLHDE